MDSEMTYSYKYLFTEGRYQNIIRNYKLKEQQ